MSVMNDKRKIVAMLNCHDDDVFCFRKEIIDDLADHGYTVLVSCPYGERINSILRDNVIYEDIKIDRRGKNPFTDYRLYKDYLALFKKYRPLAVLAFTIKPNIYGGLAAKKLGIPYVNNITGLGSGYENGGLVKSIILTMYRIVLNSAHHIFFQNRANRDKILATGILHHNRFEVIPGSGVNLERFRYCEYPKTENIVFNYIGRVMREKNIDDYIYIAKIIHEKHKNTIFNVIGFIEPTEFHYKTELAELEQQGIIRYLGPQKDVQPLIKDSYAIIHPSTYGEGLSNVLLESAATGRVLFTTPLPGCGETVEDGINGFLFEPCNRPMMVELVEKFINLSHEEKIKMGIASRRITEKLFSREIVVKKYRNLIQHI